MYTNGSFVKSHFHEFGLNDPSSIHSDNGAQFRRLANCRLGQFRETADQVGEIVPDFLQSHGLTASRSTSSALPIITPFSL